MKKCCFKTTQVANKSERYEEIIKFLKNHLKYYSFSISFQITVKILKVINSKSNTFTEHPQCFILKTICFSFMTVVIPTEILKANSGCNSNDIPIST